MDNCRWILEAGDVKEEFSDRQLDSFLEGQLNLVIFMDFTEKTLRSSPLISRKKQRE